MAPKCHNPALGEQIEGITEAVVEESFKGQGNENTLFEGILVIPKKMVKSRLRRALVEVCNSNPVDGFMLTRMEHVFLLEIDAMKSDPKLRNYLEPWGRSWIMAIEISKGNPVMLYALLRRSRDRISRRGKDYAKDLTVMHTDLKNFAKEVKTDKDLQHNYKIKLEKAEKSIAKA